MSVVQCPVCQSDVQAGFGMVVCPQCRTPLFFDFDGNLQMATEDDSLVAHENNDLNLESPPVLPLENQFENFHQDSTQDTIQESIHDSAQEQDVDLFQAQVDVQNQEQSQEFHHEQLQDHYSSQLQNVVSEQVKSVDHSSSQNSFIYQITIKGIDGIRLRSEIYEELKDPRWGWVALELMDQIKGGELILKNVNAVKASLLINRLKSLPIEITWMVQNEINSFS